MRRDQSYDVNRDSGVMLLEALIAVSISLILIVALTQIYISMRDSDRHRRILMDMQYRAQKVIDILREEIHLAGYIGCGKLTSEFVVQPYQQYSLTVDNYLDVDLNQITVRYQAYSGVELTKNMRDKTKMTANLAARYHAGQILIISDCSHAEIFQVGDISAGGSGQVIIPRHELQHLYHKHAEIGAYVSHHYFLDKSRYQQPGKPKIFAVFRTDANLRTHEVIEGIDQLSFVRDKQNVAFNFLIENNDIKLHWSAYVGTHGNGAS